MDSELSSGESQDSPVLCHRATAYSGVSVLQSAEPTSIGQPVSEVLVEAPDENSYDSDDCFFAWGIQRALVALHQNSLSSVPSPGALLVFFFLSASSSLFALHDNVPAGGSLTSTMNTQKYLLPHPSVSLSVLSRCLCTTHCRQRCLPWRSVCRWRRGDFPNCQHGERCRSLRLTTTKRSFHLKT